MKLHWSPKSPFVRKVMMTAMETGQLDRIELVRSPVAITSLNPAVMRDNPLNKIPTLVLDDGSVLSDSFVICTYLDSLHDGPRMIPGGAANLETLRVHALANGLIDSLILWRNERDRPASAQSQPHMDAYAVKADAMLDHIERVEIEKLKARAFDLSHITVGVAMGYLDFRFANLDWRKDRPLSAAWFETFSLRPSAAGTAPVE